MIKALFLIFEPEAAWNRVAQSSRGIGSIVAFYLAPMMLLVGAAEWFGLVRWGHWQSGMATIKQFSTNEALIYELGALLLMAVVILVSAHIIKTLGDTFHVRNTYASALTVVIYGLSPAFLLRLLDIFPAINSWLPWGGGILLAAKTLYHGVPRIMRPDPPDAFGLFFMSAFLLTLTTGMERLITTGCLGGSFKPVNNLVSHLATHLHF